MSGYPVSHDLSVRSLSWALALFVDRDVLALLTLPTWGCLCYAVGITVGLAHSQNAQAKEFKK